MPFLRMLAASKRASGTSLGVARQPRLLIVAHDIPYPPQHGGRRDIWNRIVGLSARGVALDMLTWSDKPVLDEEREALAVHVGRLNVQRPNYSLARASVSRLPTRVLFRRLSRREMREELSQSSERGIDAVVLDGIYGALAALDLSRDLGVPLIYRSHNVEHQYMRALAKSSTSLARSLIYGEEARRTLPIEVNVRRAAAAVYDICVDDSEAWSRDGSVPASHVLPYVCDVSAAEAPDSVPHLPIDVLYAGSLGAPNQLQGLLWFLNEIVPRLGGLRIVLAGATPHPTLIARAGSLGIEVLPNPLDMGSLYRSARVLVNPVLHSAGVNVKTIELLATGRPVVSTAAGARGLDRRMLKHLVLADSSTLFAAGVFASLEMSDCADQRTTVIECHGPHHLDSFIEDLTALVGAP